MRRTLAVLALATGLVPVAGGTAWACSCRIEREEAAQYRRIAERASAVYVGEVLGPYEGGGYDVRVERSLKGGVSGRRHVKAAQDQAACGVELEPGRVFLVERNGRTDACMGTDQGDDVDSRAATYALHNPVDPPQSGTGTGVRVMAAVAAGLAAAGWLLARRRAAA